MNRVRPILRPRRSAFRVRTAVRAGALRCSRLHDGIDCTFSNYGVFQKRLADEFGVSLY